MPSDPEPYRLAVSPRAARSLAEELPITVAHAVIGLITGALLASPRMVGKPLRGSFEGLWVARRGPYRVVYEISEGERTVQVLRIEHRRDVYR